jgi:Zn-dependent M28 family amino/carboxypeptidase
VPSNGLGSTSVVGVPGALDLLLVSALLLELAYQASNLLSREEQAP